VNDLYKALPHMIMATLVIAAAVVLAAMGIITGGEAIALIGAGGGFTLGGTVASGSISTAASAAADASHSIGATATPAPGTVTTTQTTTPPAS